MERKEKWGVWGWGPVGRGWTLMVGTLEEKEGTAGLTLVGFFRDLPPRRRRGETRVPFFKKNLSGRAAVTHVHQVRDTTLLMQLHEH